jgi:hypothetical protein
MQILSWSALAFLACGTVASAGVPCGVFGGPAGCPNPIVQGEVDGQWVGLTYHFNGTNGGPDSIAVVTVGFGGNGALTTVLAPIRPEGREGDRLSADFVDKKLRVRNAVYLPGQAHCCYTLVVVRQFGFHDRLLRVEKSATVPSDATEAQIGEALARASRP